MDITWDIKYIIGGVQVGYGRGEVCKSLSGVTPEGCTDLFRKAVAILLQCRQTNPKGRPKASFVPSESVI